MTDSAYMLSLDIDDFRQSRVEMQPEPNADLVEGEIRVRVDKIAMTANSISYGFAGKSGLIRYLDIYAASERSEERRVGKECRSRWSPYH